MWCVCICSEKIARFVWQQLMTEHCEALYVCKTCADGLVQAVAELLWRAPDLACMPASIGATGLVGSKLHVACGLISWLLRSQVEKLKQGSTGDGHSRSQRRSAWRACTNQWADCDKDCCSALPHSSQALR